MAEQLSTCPVCHSDQIALSFVAPTTRPSALPPREWQIWNCAACGHGFLNPQLNWSELAPYYEQGYEPYTEDYAGAGGDAAHLREEAKRSGTLRHIPVPVGKALLDVGCGAGWFLRTAAELGATRVQGIEPSAVAAERAAGQGVSVFCGTLDAYLAANSAGDAFDIITANHVLEHVPDPVATLGQMKQLLAADGMIWIAVPNADSWSARALKGHWHSTDVPLHLQQFTAASLQQAAERAELAVSRSYTYSLPSGLAASLRDWLRFRWRIPRRLSQRVGWIDRAWAPRLAAKLDMQRRGEAIIIELQRGATDG